MTPRDVIAKELERWESLSEEGDLDMADSILSALHDAGWALCKRIECDGGVMYERSDGFSAVMGYDVEEQFLAALKDKP